MMLLRIIVSDGAGDRDVTGWSFVFPGTGTFGGKIAHRAIVR